MVRSKGCTNLGMDINIGGLCVVDDNNARWMRMGHVTTVKDEGGAVRSCGGLGWGWVWWWWTGVGSQEGGGDNFRSEEKGKRW